MMAFCCCDAEGVDAPFVGYFCSLKWPQKKKQEPSTFNPGPSSPSPSTPSHFLSLVAYRQVAVLVETYLFPCLPPSSPFLWRPWGFLLNRRSKLSIVRSQHLFSRSKIKVTVNFVALGVLFDTLKFKVCLILGRGPGLISAFCF